MVPGRPTRELDFVPFFLNVFVGDNKMMMVVCVLCVTYVWRVPGTRPPPVVIVSFCSVDR